MGDYTYSQLEGLWIQAGGSKTLAPLMAAIALAESGGNPDAVNSSSDATGLWQINLSAGSGSYIPGGPGNATNPLDNAKGAVAIYQAQGLDAWQTYTTGAYKQYYQGNIPPTSGGPPGTSGGGTGGGGSGGADPAVLTSFWSSLGNDLKSPENELQQAIKDAWGAITSPSKDAVDVGTALTQITRVFTALAGIADKLFESLEWLFVPSHWTRILCFAGGLMFFIPGLYAMMRTGSGGSYGDITLALGILMITLSGVLFFIAFHNLPTDVTNLQELLGWISESVREGKAASHTSG